MLCLGIDFNVITLPVHVVYVRFAIDSAKMACRTKCKSNLRQLQCESVCRRAKTDLLADKTQTMATCQGTLRVSFLSSSCLSSLDA